MLYSILKRHGILYVKLFDLIELLTEITAAYIHENKHFHYLFSAFHIIAPLIPFPYCRRHHTAFPSSLYLDHSSVTFPSDPQIQKKFIKKLKEISNHNYKIR